MLTVIEYSEKYGVAKSTVYAAIKSKRLVSSKELRNKRMVKVVEDMDLNAPTEESIQESKAILANSPVALLRFLQEEHGGSVHNCDWVAEDAPEIDTTTEVFTNPKVFVDTVFIAFPSHFSILKGVDGSTLSYIPLPDSIKAAVSFIKHTFYEGKAQDIPFDNNGRLVTAIPSTKPFVIDDTTIVFNTPNKIKAADITSGTYWGYQLYRASTCNLDPTKVLDLVASIGKNQDGRAMHDGNRVYIFKVDVTSNVPGAVEPKIIPHAIEHLEYKTNKKYVGECCHTYVAFKSEEGELRENEDDHEEQIPFNNAVLAPIKEEILNTKAMLEAELKPFTLFYEQWSKVESKGTSLLEAKVYDKARFQMEVGTVDSTIGNGVHNFLNSTQDNIREAIADNINKGMGRVETRFIGYSCFISPAAMLRAHKAFVEVLSRAYLHENPVDISIASLLDTVKATVSIAIGSGDSYDFFYANWQSSLTGKVNGGIVANTNQSEIDNYLMYRTIRTVPHVHYVMHVEDVVGSIAISKDLAGARQVTLPRGLYGKLIEPYNKKGVFIIDKVMVSAPVLGIANLNHITSDTYKGSYASTSFRSIGLSSMPFEPQHINPEPRKFKEVEEKNFKKVDRLLHTPYYTVAKAKAKVALKELSKKTMHELPLVYDVSKAKPVPKNRNLIGKVIETGGKYYLFNTLFYILDIKGKLQLDYMASILGKTCQVSRKPSPTGIHYSFLPL